MLAKKHRLTGRSVLEEVKKEGSLYQADSFGILVRKGVEIRPSRFAFIVSTKISKTAVDRNKVKRRLREAVKQNIEKIVKGYDVVFLAKKMTLGGCRYYPTCSDYSREALVNYGLGKGTWISIKRLSRCHPFSKAGVYDPLPSK